MIEAVEGSVNGGGLSQMHGGGESSEEELSVLPRHTKVVVTGNNRTKSVLVGLQGVVKKAVGLGGWHWLVLTNGIEVKLQRNALSVIEAPTGNEEDDDFEFENGSWMGSDLASDDTQKSHRSRNRMPKSSGSSHKTMGRSLSCNSESKGSLSPHRGSAVDLSKLEMAALWRYCRHFNLVEAVPNPSREQLIDVVQRHFMSQQLDELQVIVGFVQAAKRPKTICSVVNGGVAVLVMGFDRWDTIWVPRLMPSQWLPILSLFLKVLLSMAVVAPFVRRFDRPDESWLPWLLFPWCVPPLFCLCLKVSSPSFISVDGKADLSKPMATASGARKNVPQSKVVQTGRGFITHIESFVAIWLKYTQLV
ncbi:hypothetical protein Nepgr_015718 [Nepenthes gracilis]|uniref:Histone deacetylase complex subunit SAP30 Sin3 binding domain-containing protein n=1 Tax=Nepenthes gracilis TaxID=150966 RepID=A0AAD3SNS0_NEPGR|nr:hypothetical protein Nepgr_015718 [Nepenthes gracilis]